MTGNQLDATDKKILRILQERGRITNLQLSQEIGLSPAPTLERVRKLEKASIIRSYHARLDEKALGFGMKVIIQVSLSRQVTNASEKFTEHIRNLDEIVECVQITGDFDYLLKVMVKDIAEYDRLVNETLSRIEGIGQMRSSVILSTLKQAQSIPIR